jgi:predicted ester cyclase
MLRERDEGLKLRMDFLQEAFPGGRITIDETLAEGDKVVYRFSFRGTHGGNFFGAAGTGSRVSFEGITIVRIAGGKIAEHWGYFDLTGVLEQVGRPLA